MKKILGLFCGIFAALMIAGCAAPSGESSANEKNVLFLKSQRIMVS